MPEAVPIRFADVTLGYDRHPAVHHLTGVIAAGALLAVCGPNGAGKSTLLKGIAGIVSPLSGRIERGNLSPRDIAYLPQLIDIDRSFPINVQDFVGLGALRRKGLFGRVDDAELDRIAGALAAVRLEGFENRALDTLSGGQMQRALFARLIVQNQSVILLDEPFGAVDEATTEDLLHLIGHWREEGRTVVAVLHDFDLVPRAFPQTLLLAREPVFWGDTREALTRANLAKARGMAEAYDDAAHECHRDGEQGPRAHVV